MGSSLAASIAELDPERALEQVRARIDRKEDPQTILLECRQGMEEVGARFESCEYFTADLVYAAEIFKEIMEIVGPELRTRANEERLGSILIATVKDDIHDIGKNLVAAMLDAAGFEVVDLGVDVSADAICSSIREHSSDILALSCLLTTTVDSMESTIQGVSKAGLRDRVKVIVGGIPLSAKIASEIGADAYGANAHEAVARCRELMGAKRNA